MSVCPVVCTCTTFIFNITLVCGDVKVYFIIFEANLARNLGLLAIIGFIISLRHGGINP